MRRFKKRPTNDWAGQGCAKVAERAEVTYFARFKVHMQSL